MYQGYTFGLFYYQYVKKKPARGESTIIIIEKLKDSTDVRVARCSDGNIFCSLAFVLTCSASSPIAAIKPPKLLCRNV
ncbi:hypothetical protein [Ruminococcus flavefaciens]|uniref:hypothetical protein n=1 Tax=Ruminococcus flavefaciens TaxID=1265 RepID=UPI0015877C8B|nr:hypothetical protein [Ruminococcus flavefaciens]